LLIVLLIIQIVWQALQIGGDTWVAYGASPDGDDSSQNARFVVVYAIIALCNGLTVLLRSTLLAYIGLSTAQSFYLRMLRSLFRAPMSFFDTTPTGRILSRVRHHVTFCLLSMLLMFSTRG
jgi:ABC-type multidrug transport system fused ATPase/permease subunit